MASKLSRIPREHTQKLGEVFHPAAERDAARRVAGATIRAVPIKLEAKASAAGVSLATQSRRETGHATSPLSQALQETIAEARQLGPEAATRYARLIEAAGLLAEIRESRTTDLLERERDAHIAETEAQAEYDPVQMAVLAGVHVCRVKRHTLILAHLSRLTELLALNAELLSRELD